MTMSGIVNASQVLRWTRCCCGDYLSHGRSSTEVASSLAVCLGSRSADGSVPGHQRSDGDVTRMRYSGSSMDGEEEVEQ